MTIDESPKLNLFISYANADKDKINIISTELEDHFLFVPIIIATNREPLKPLVTKVKEGVERSAVVTPVLTSNSISAQWINQEIGYANGIEKIICPILEINIIKKLKGFIHKEIDLPYTYEKNLDKAIENESFLKAFRLLLADLEKKSKDLVTEVEYSAGYL